jgi:poly(rC)-binding protein 2/3/4
MSASPPQSATAPSSKRPLEEPSSPSGPGDQPDAKRPALDKILKEEPVASDPVPDTDGASAEAEPVAEAKTEQNGNHVADSDTVVPDAPTGVPTGSEVLSNGQNLQHQSQGRQDETNWLHVRAIISSAEAATVIGKGGENVSQIRKLSAARCTVSDYARGAVERVLTVSGQVDAVAKVRPCLCYEMERMLTITRHLVSSFAH